MLYLVNICESSGEMGYSREAAEQGLIATNNKGVQPAMDWILTHDCLKPTQAVQSVVSL